MTDSVKPVPVPPPPSDDELRRAETKKKTDARHKYYFDHLLEHFAVAPEVLRDTELVESAVLKYCIEQGATTFTETDIAGIVGQANNAISSMYLPDWMFDDTLFINYKTLSFEQRREVRDILNKTLNLETYTLEDFERDVATRYGAYVTGNFGQFRNLIFIDVTAFCETILPLLHE